MTIYTSFYNVDRNFNNLFTQARQAIHNAGITGMLYFGDTLKIKIETIDDIKLLAMVALWRGKYYCFNFHPDRNEVVLTHTLDKCDMDKQLNESLASLRRLYESKT